MIRFRTHKEWKTLILHTAVLTVAATLLLTASLIATSFFMPFPEVLQSQPESGRRIEDRDGLLLARTRANDDVWRVPLRLSEAGPHLAAAMVAAEDKRFYFHPGVDPLSITRAGIQAIGNLGLVSGASTITQQLARSTFERERSLSGKWKEMALALTIERNLSKDEILEEYLNRVSFGPKIAGARAAADHYFGKPLRALDRSEAAILASLVRGPTIYDPRKRPDLTLRERNRVLRRMREHGSITREERTRAESMPITLRPRPPISGGHHWVRWVANQGHNRRLRTTLFGPLQQESEDILRQQTRALQERGVSASAAVILDNNSGDVLSYVGSPDFSSKDGQNDGVRALRQPGSTLKPFAYGLAFEHLGMTAATLLPDQPLHFRTSQGHYSPKNFDRRFRGSVRLGRALANSLNVPAVYVVDKLGVGTFLSALRNLGFTSLDQTPSHYGPALALGDGEIRLLDLAAAYSTLARGGVVMTPRLFLNQPRNDGEQVLSPTTCALLTEILSDDRARREAFGSHNALDLDFPVAVKTGTSKGFRDSWTVGYTRDFTVAVWVGNFDGRATKRVSGAVGAGRLFRSLMTAAQNHRPSGPVEEGQRPLHDVDLHRRAICADTGTPVGPNCRQRVDEWFAPDQYPEALLEPADSTEVVFPKNGMTFVYDPAIPKSRQRLLLRAASSDMDRVSLSLNGKPLSTHRGRSEWTLRPGGFQLRATGENGVSSPVFFTVKKREAP